MKFLLLLLLSSSLHSAATQKAWWKLQDLTDSSGNGFTLVDNGTTPITVGDITVTAQEGTSYACPCTDTNYLKAPAGFLTAFQNNSIYSVEFQFYANSFANAPVVLSWSNGTDYSYFQFNGSGELTWNVNGNSIHVSGLPPNVYTGNWIKIALVDTGAVRKLLLNGIQIGSNGTSATFTTVTKFYIGRYVDGTSFAFNGVIDDVIVYTGGIAALFPTDPTTYPAATWNIDWFGHSMVQGTTCVAGTASMASDGMRSRLVSDLQGVGINEQLVGQLRQGGISQFFTDGIGGYYPSHVLNDIDTRLQQNSSTNVVILGPQITNWERDGGSTVTAKAQIDAQVNSVFARIPNAKLLISTDPVRTSGENPIYNYAVWQSYTTAIGVYPSKTIGFVSLSLCAGCNDLCDGVHASNAGNPAQADAIAAALETMLPTDTPTATPTPTATNTPLPSRGNPSRTWDRTRAMIKVEPTPIRSAYLRR